LIDNVINFGQVKAFFPPWRGASLSELAAADGAYQFERGFRSTGVPRFAYALETPSPVQLNSHITQAITVTIARPTTI
jgi:hypothetical protein